MATEEAKRTVPPHLDTEQPDLDEVPGILDHLREYAVHRPDVAAFWCFGIGFILGWKLKPW